MDNLAQKINDILVREDIEGLISMGAPEDEYQMESQKISEMINLLSHNERNLENIASVIAVVWGEYFGPYPENEMSRRMPQFQRVASQII